MIIVCPNCNKKFEIDKKLIPIEGRMLQCGSCDHKWFYKIEKIKKEFSNEKLQINNDSIKTNQKQSTVSENKLKYQEEKNITTSEINVKAKKNNISYFKFLLVIIISFISLILLLDTFKEPLEKIFPNIQIILDNLYQSLKDIKLFILDLIK